jgi:3-isopropylmalate/(R)-2-methylmalate dehydratase small subunit
MTIDSRIRSIRARGIAIRGNEIDTDRIIPARFLCCVVFDGLGENAFRDERFAPDGSAKSHPMNDVRFAGAGVLTANGNFGCGSSREHAPQALARWGIKAIVGESFADIFAGNCAAIGLPVVTASPSDIETLQAAIEADPGMEILVDLEAMKVGFGDAGIAVSMPESQRRKFLAGSWDSMAALLVNLEAAGRLASGLPYIAGFGTGGIRA